MDESASSRMAEIWSMLCTRGLCVVLLHIKACLRKVLEVAADDWVV